MSQCSRCSIVGGNVWPRCVGPNGCMRSKVKKPIVTATPAFQPWETKKVAKPETKQRPSPKPEPTKPKLSPKLEPEPTKPKPKKIRGKGRSVSVSLPMYIRLKEASRVRRVTMAHIVEQSCRMFFGDDEKEST